MTTDDLRYAWAAYRRGWSLLPTGLSIDNFKAQLTSLLAAFSEVYILSAPSMNHVLFPVGILVIVGGSRCEPHIDWFPWVSKRNRVELIIKAVREFRKRAKLMIYASETDNMAFRVVRAYGLLKFGCKVDNFFPNGDYAYFYYTV